MASKLVRVVFKGQTIYHNANAEILDKQLKVVQKEEEVTKGIISLNAERLKATKKQSG